MNIIITGCGTDVGKTTVSMLLVEKLGADYWKPIESGSDSDTENIRKRFPDRVHPPAYTFKNPVSPHHAARIENRVIDPLQIMIPQTERSLIIETAGGIFVPLNAKLLSIDLFASWEAEWIIVSRHYLGSINHTLLTIGGLRARGVAIRGIIFNGEPNPDSEEAILNFSHLPCLGRLLPEKEVQWTI
jgi:dethiobiotin synthetase